MKGTSKKTDQRKKATFYSPPISQVSLRINFYSDNNIFMCGSASTTSVDQEPAFAYLNRKLLVIPENRPNYNLFPAPCKVILIVIGNRREFNNNMVFGLIPFWANDIKNTNGCSLINVNAKEITEWNGGSIISVALKNAGANFHYHSISK